jgi:hypothetical protein
MGRFCPWRQAATGHKRTLTKECFVPLFADHRERKLDATALNNQGTCRSYRITPLF